MYLPDDSFIGSFLEIVTLTSARKMELKIQFRNPLQSSSFRFVEITKKDSSYRFIRRKEEIKLFLSRYRQVFEEVGSLFNRSLVSSNLDWNISLKTGYSEGTYFSKLPLITSLSLNSGRKLPPILAKIFSPFFASFLPSFPRKRKGKKETKVKTKVGSPRRLVGREVWRRGNAILIGAAVGLGSWTDLG